MTIFWPTGIYVHGKEYETAFTSSPVENLDAAINQFHIWEDSYGYKFIKKWIQAYDKDSDKMDILVDINRNLVKELWENFGDVPINPETERIMDFWGRFVPGDCREDIWHWFEDTFGVSVGLLMEGII